MRHDELYHFGILGMKWGIRRFQNDDGSLTPAGRERYLKNPARSIGDNVGKKELTNAGKRAVISNIKKRYGGDMGVETAVFNTDNFGMRSKYKKVANNKELMDIMEHFNYTAGINKPKEHQFDVLNRYRLMLGDIFDAEPGTFVYTDNGRGTGFNPSAYAVYCQLFIRDLGGYEKAKQTYQDLSELLDSVWMSYIDVVDNELRSMGIKDKVTQTVLENIVTRTSTETGEEEIISAHAVDGAVDQIVNSEIGKLRFYFT